MAPSRGISLTALFSFLLGVLCLAPLALVLASWQAPILARLSGFFCLGPLALLLGIMGLREVNRSDGMLRGQKLAIGGMALGGLATLVLVGGLAALFILRARQQGNLATSINNLRVVFQATHIYVDQEHEFPVGTIENPALTPSRRLSWYVRLLPFMEQDPKKPRETRETALNQAINRKLAWDAADNDGAVHTPLPVLICPAHPDGLPVAAPTYYVGLAGVGLDAAELPLSSPNAGMFGYDRAVHLEDLLGPDGRGPDETVMVSETEVQIGFWAEGGPATVRGLDPAASPYLGQDRPFGGLYPGVTHVLFAGGAAQTLSDGVDPLVFQNLLRLHVSP